MYTSFIIFVSLFGKKFPICWFNWYIVLMNMLCAVRLVPALVQLLNSMLLCHVNYSWLMVACGAVKPSVEMTCKVSSYWL